MKITRTSGFSNQTKEYSVSEAILATFEDTHDYYGNKTDNAVRELEVVTIRIAALVEMLEEKNILNRYDIEKLLGYSFEVKP